MLYFLLIECLEYGNVLIYADGMFDAHAPRGAPLRGAGRAGGAEQVDDPAVQGGGGDQVTGHGDLSGRGSDAQFTRAVHTISSADNGPGEWPKRVAIAAAALSIWARVPVSTGT